jgi:O-antigen/teichoic acid export membrane protein
VSQLKKLAGETAIYGISSMLGRMLNFLLVPFYTGVFPPGEYGIITKLYAFVAFFNVLYTFGLETAYFRFAFRNLEDENKAYSVAQSAVLGITLIFTLGLISFATPIASALGYPGKGNFIIWLALILAIDAAVAIPFAKLRLEKKPVLFATAKMLNIALNIIFNLLLIVFLRQIYQGEILTGLQPMVKSFYNPEKGVEFVIISNLLANLFFIFFLWKYIRKARIGFDWEYFKPMLHYAYPILITGLAGVTNEMLSRVMLDGWLPKGFYPGKTTEDALGIFGACYKLSVFMNLGIQAFRFAAEPFFFSKEKDKGSKDLFAETMHWFVLAGCLTFLAISINLDLLQQILRREAYREGMHIVPMLTLGYFFLGIYYNLSVWFKLTDKTYYGTYISVGGAILTVVLNIILIPHYGYEGSSLVTFLCYFLMSIACFYFGQKYYPIPYKTLRDVY